MNQGKEERLERKEWQKYTEWDTVTVRIIGRAASK